MFLLSCLFVYVFLSLDCWYFLYLDMRFTIQVKETESPLTIEFQTFTKYDSTILSIVYNTEWL
jgi:hypothetical protein